MKRRSRNWTESSGFHLHFSLQNVFSVILYWPSCHSKVCITFFRTNNMETVNKYHLSLFIALHKLTMNEKAINILFCVSRKCNSGHTTRFLRVIIRYRKTRRKIFCSACKTNVYETAQTEHNSSLSNVSSIVYFTFMPHPRRHGALMRSKCMLCTPVSFTTCIAKLTLFFLPLSIEVNQY